MIQKMMKNHRKFMKGQKGFSLVELIIVIAIMAALIAVLAPQYLKYVEKSRVTADENVIGEICNAIKVAAVDEDYEIKAGIIILSKTASPTLDTSYEDALEEYYGSDYMKIRLKSKEYAGGVTITVGGDPTSGFTVTWDKTTT